MNSLRAPQPRAAVPCPSCGAMLVVSPARRREKVQCPKCREVIAVPLSAAAPPAESGAGHAAAPGDSPPPPPEPGALEARVAVLEERLASMQRELAALEALLAPPEPKRALASPPRAQEPMEVAIGRPPKPAPPPAASPALPQGGPAARMGHPLAEGAPGSVAIRAESRDAAALQFARWLADLFAKAGWTIAEFEVCPLTGGERQLCLITRANFPEPRLVASIHRMLAAAGLGLVFGIDPASDSPVPLLVVPIKPEGFSLGAEQKD